MSCSPRSRALFVTTFRSAHCHAASPVRTLDRLDVTRSGDLIEIRARARLARREWPEALADAEVVAEAQPRFGRAYATRGAVKFATKDIAAATADADKAIELDPGLFDAHELKADILLASGDQPGARPLLARPRA